MPQIVEIPNYGEVEFPDDMSTQDIEVAIKQNVLKQSDEMQEDYVPEWGRKYPNLYGVVGAGYEVSKPILEYGGLAGGALVGAGSGLLTGPGAVAASPVGAAVGGGLGYAAGKRATRGLSNVLGLTEPETLPEALVQTGQDVLTGASVEATGQVAGAGVAKLAEKARPAIQGAARKLYESAIKPSPSMPIKMRDKILTTGLEQAAKGKPYRPTEKHVFKLGKRINSLVTEADEVVKSASKKGDVINTEKLTAGIDDVLSQFQAGPFPQGDIKRLGILKEELMASHGKAIPTDKALAMKKQIYKIAKKYYSNSRATLAPAKFEAEKAVASAIVKELEALYPATRPLNKEAGKLIEFTQVLERAAGRVGNREVLSLLDFMGGTVGATATGGGQGAVAGAVATKMLTGPQIKSMLAKSIYKASMPQPTKNFLIRQLARYKPLPKWEEYYKNGGNVSRGTFMDRLTMHKRPFRHLVGKDVNKKTLQEPSEEVLGQ